MVANAGVVIIILRYVNVSNQHVVHLPGTRCYKSIISQLSWRKKRQDTDLSLLVAQIHLVGGTLGCYSESILKHLLV